jgi:cytochrome c peroxidase
LLVGPGRNSMVTRRSVLGAVRRYSSTTTAASKPKEAPARPPPPPATPNDERGGSFWPAFGLTTAAILGYFYRDEFGKVLGLNAAVVQDTSTAASSAKSKSVPAAMGSDGTGLSIKELRHEVEQLAQRLEAEERASHERAAAAAAVAAAAAKAKAEAQAAAAAQAAADAALRSARYPGSQVGVVQLPGTPAQVDYAAVRAEIVKILDEEGYDDGSIGPLLVRLAWHSAGTYDAATQRGGSEGACMRFEGGNEASWGANAGLALARARLEPIKAAFPNITFSDLWSLAGTTALEEMGAGDLKWRPGRKDFDASWNYLPNGLLPDADGRGKAPAAHLRDIFGRMGFNDQEIVALSGAHSLGRCHPDRSGFVGPWTRAPTTLSNEYFRLLLEETWSKKRTHLGREWKGPLQFENSETGADLMMLETDMALVSDPAFKVVVDKYAKDNELFLKDFASAWKKLQENGVRKFNGRRRYFIFGPRE